MAATPIESQVKSSRVYYVIRDDATHCTSNRIHAASIAAEWIRRGYKNVEAVVAEQVDDHIEQVQS